MASVWAIKEVLGRGGCQRLGAPCARAETAAAGLAETGAWFATATDVHATEIGLLHTGPAGTRIGIREIGTSDIRGWCAQAPSAFRFSAVAIVISGGSVDPISSPGPVIPIGHVWPPGISSVATR
jgi:hypothetical protein